MSMTLVAIVSWGLFPFRSNAQLINDYEYVDLGLPSRIKWATCNVGAVSPSDYGDYFAWGETEPKDTYTHQNNDTWETYLGDISGNPQYDAARANWGSSWRLPTKKEWEELRRVCRWKWSILNNCRGYKVIGRNGKSIFLPAAGYRSESSLHEAQKIGGYWSSTPVDQDNTQRAYRYNIYRENYIRSQSYRYRGWSVRPVSK
ncbi:MAG: hypothetical protein K2H04_01335 [Bacteroidaceae bacterium]|nr:hypothetical protein [Bacteroidaceae bacterium]